jgi:predicted phage terminase large subunit-like protein
MEQEPGSSGKSVIDDYRRTVFEGYTFRAVLGLGDKVSRADPLCAAAEAGNVVLLAGPWNEALLDEMEVFPNGSNDDQVDGLSGAFAMLTRGPSAPEVRRLGGL